MLGVGGRGFGSLQATRRNPLPLIHEGMTSSINSFSHTSTRAAAFSSLFQKCPIKAQFDCDYVAGLVLDEGYLKDCSSTRLTNTQSRKPKHQTALRPMLPPRPKNPNSKILQSARLKQSLPKLHGYMVVPKT